MNQSAKSPRLSGLATERARPVDPAGPSRIDRLMEEFARSIAKHVVDLLRANEMPEYYDQSSSPLGRRRFIGLVRRGEVPGVRVGRRFLAKRVDVDRWMVLNGIEPRSTPGASWTDDLARELGLVKRR